VLHHLPNFLGPDLLVKDKLRIFIHPQQIVLLRIKRSNTQHILRKQIVPCVAANVEANSLADNTELIWFRAVRTLASALQDECWQGAKPQIVLSNHFVRYALVPWHDGLVNKDERQAYLRHSFQLAYGDSAKGWDLRMSDNRVQRTALASGVEQGLLLHLQQTFEGLGLNVNGIHPHLMVAINQLRQQENYYAYWFVLVENGRLCIALIQDGNWLSVKTCNSEDDITTQIAALIERESVICGVNTSGWPVLVYWPGHADMTMQLANRKVVWIRPLHLQASVEMDNAAHQSAQASKQDNDLELVMWA